MMYRTIKLRQKQHAERKAARKTTPYKDGLGKARKLARDTLAATTLAGTLK